MRASFVVESVIEFKEVAGGIGEEKTGVYDEFSQQFSLAMLIFVFLAFPKSTEDCDVVANIVGFVWVLRSLYVVVNS